MDSEHFITGNTAASDCLAGMRILDLTQFEAGPTCTEALAWLGAEVVKVENPKAGDPGRTGKGPKPGKDASYFLQFNANKKSITVNLKDPRGLALVKDLAKKADVFIENFAPGGIERLGLGADVVRALNPAIIYCQVKGFGAGSPFEKNLAYDMIAQAASGLMSVTGEETGPPCKAGSTLGDTGSGMLMAISILAAYTRARRTGQGDTLQLAMQDSLMHYIRQSFIVTEQTGEAAPRVGARTIGGGAVYPCKGGGPNDYVYIYANGTNPEHWVRLLKVIGREDLIGDTRYDTLPARNERRDEVEGMISAWTMRHDKHEAMRLIGDAAVPASAVLDTRELANDPSFAQRGIRQTVEHPEIGPYVMNGWPVTFGGQAPKVAPAPLLGQHNPDVLRDWLGLDADAVGTLRQESVIGR